MKYLFCVRSWRGGQSPRRSRCLWWGISLCSHNVRRGRIHRSNALSVKRPQFNNMPETSISPTLQMPPLRMQLFYVGCLDEKMLHTAGSIMFWYQRQMSSKEDLSSTSVEATAAAIFRFYSIQSPFVANQSIKHQRKHPQMKRLTSSLWAVGASLLGKLSQSCLLSFFSLSIFHHCREPKKKYKKKRDLFQSFTDYIKEKKQL